MGLAFNYQILLLLAVWFIAYFNALVSAVEVWWVSNTYFHCFFVLPASAYMIWLKRGALKGLRLKPNFWVGPLFLPVVFIGVVGDVGDINFFRHVSAFAFVPLAIWFLAGNEICRRIWFPLVFMLFSVPVGEELVPILQRITADLAVLLLAGTSIPVFSDGLYIEIPAGVFVVAEACSGIRFFVGSVVFGCVYSYFSFKTKRFAALYLVLSVSIPVLANAFRVFGLVVVGHVFGMEHASGTDHLVYGWFFFAFVILLMLLFGELIRKLEPKENSQNAVSKLENIDDAIFNVSVFPLTLLVLVLCLYCIWGSSVQNDKPTDQWLGGLNSSQRVGYLPKERQAAIMGATEYVQIRVKPDIYAEIFLFGPKSEGSEKDKELVSSQHRMFDVNHWSVSSSRRVDVSDGSYRLIDLVSGSGEKRIVAYSYILPSYKTHSSFVAKMLQTFDKITNGRGAGAIVVFSTDTRSGSLDIDKARLLEVLSRQGELLKNVLTLY